MRLQTGRMEQFSRLFLMFDHQPLKSIGDFKLTRDRLGGGVGSDPSWFFLITSVALQVSTRNLAYLSVHQLHVLTQNVEKNLDMFLNYTDVSDPMSCLFGRKLIKI